MKRLTCARCKKPISGARTVIDGVFCCARCTYEHDLGREATPPTRHRAPPLQKETLFTPPPKVEKR